MNVIRDPRVQLIVSLLLSAGLAVFVLRRVLRRVTARLHRFAPNEDQHVMAELLRAAIAPLSFLAWYYVLYAIARIVVLSDWVHADLSVADVALRRCATLGVFIGFLWYFFGATVAIDRRLRRAAGRTTTKVDDVLYPLIGTMLRVTVPMIAVFVLLQLWPISANALAVVRKLLAIALIGAIAWTLRRAVLLVDAVVVGTSDFATATTAESRALFTRVHMLRRIALVVIAVFAFAAILMMFPEVRSVGRSILASAGIAGIVLGIAAQRSLGNLLAGVQIALTQPIRLGDQVLVEGDVGNIEEITLTYVVVRVWDQRRIVLPISYFIEKPFQNWTRVTTNMLSPLTLRVDFSLPVDDLRTFLKAEIARSEFWDKKVFGVQVTNSDAQSMEVRVLASAPDSGASFNLQCELREKALLYIREHHPDALPRLRVTQRPRPGGFDGHDAPEHPLAATPTRRDAGTH